MLFKPSPRFTIANILLTTVLISAGCDVVAGIGDYCVVGTPECGSGGSGAGSTTTGGTSGSGGTGAVSTSSAECIPESQEPCYSGPENTKGIGACKEGDRVCSEAASWGQCEGEVTPVAETCSTPVDDDCDAKECARWSAIWGDASEQVPLDIKFDSAGNAIVLGTFNGAVDVGGGPLQSAGAWDLFIAKFDPDWKLLWSKRYGDGQSQQRGKLAIDPNDNIVVAGSFEGTLNFGGTNLTALGFDIFVAKLTPGGIEAWAHRFGDSANQSCDAVAADANGNIILFGKFTGTIAFDSPLSASASELYVAKLDGSFGTPVFSQKMQSQYDEGFAPTCRLVASGPMGSWAISEGYEDGAVIGTQPLSGAGTFVAFFDAANEIKWVKSLPLIYGGGIGFDSTGNVVLAASFDGPVDPGDGNVLPYVGGLDLATVKLASQDGKVLWSTALGGANTDWLPRLAIDSADRIFLAFGSDSDLSVAGEELPAFGANDLLVQGLDALGNPLWIRRFGDATQQQDQRLALDTTSTRLLVTTRTGGDINFGAGDLTSQGEDIAVAELAP